MSDLKPTLDKLPHWPRWLNQRDAAAYLGVSAGTFRTEFLAGVWPGPGRRCLWDRRALDAASDRISNLSTATEDKENGYGLRDSYFQDRLKDDGNGYGRDPGYIKRMLEAAYGDEGHPPSQRTSGRRRGRKK